MRRELGRFETAAALTSEHAPFNVVVGVRLAGGLDPEGLRHALDALQGLHPLLGVRIVERAGRRAYEGDGTPPVPLRLLPRDGEEAWREVAEEELNRRLDAARGPLLRCALLADPAGPAAPSELLLTFHHAIVDGASASALVERLLALCDPAVRGAGDPALEPLPAPPPAETLFPPAWRGLRGRLRLATFVARQAADELAFRLHGGARRTARPTPPGTRAARCRILPVALGAGETAALVRATRRERMTMNAALAAAFLLAACRHLRGARVSPLRYMTFADLRPYLRPPVPAEGLGACLAMLRHTIEVAPDDELWDLARDVSAQVAAGFRRGEKLASALLAETVMRHVLRRGSGRMAATAVSYAGPVRLGGPEGSASPRVRGLHAFVSNFRLGPEYTALARLFAGELCLDILYLDSDMDEPLARAMAGDVLDTLRSAAASSATP